MTFHEIKNVAVIGAGVSGVCSAAHLLKHNIQVTVFERSSIAGGVWHFDEETAPDPSYPNEAPSSGDYVKAPAELFEAGYLTPPGTPDGSGRKETIKPEPLPSRRSFAPPGACYEKLTNNVPLTLMKNSLADWPEGVDEFVNQRYLEEYIQRISHSNGVHEKTQYGVRVEDIRKIGKSWRIRTTSREDASDAVRLHPGTHYFDAVIVATGHYHNPRVPGFTGLREWKQKYPSRISHSKQYRRAAPFKDETILLVGAGTSSTDIAKELSGVAKHVYQTSRGGAFDHPAAVLPANATRVENVKAFEFEEEKDLEPDQAIPGSVILQDGQRLSGIDRVILCTGYVTSYPFLPQYHNDQSSAEEADEHVLVTSDGNMIHNLHKDIFYIEDPTLAFVGKPYHTANFSLFDFQAQLVARVFARKALFPAKAELRAEYDERIRVKGRGRDFHSLRHTGSEPAYVDSLVAWANKHISEGDGVEPMQGHTEAWLTRYAAFRKMIEERIALKLTEANADTSKDVVFISPDTS